MGKMKTHLQNWLTRWRSQSGVGGDAAALASWTMDDAGFIDAAYQKYLGRAPDISGKAYYLQRLQQQPHGRLSVLKELQNSSEAIEFVERQQRIVLVTEFEKREQHPFLPSLASDTNSDKPRIALLGTCLAESLLQTASVAAWPVHHYLMDSGPHDPVPMLPATEYDAVLVQTTLRSLLTLTTDKGNGDLFHVRSDADWSILQERAKHQLNTVLERVLSELSETMPVFFIAFLEPAPQINGILGRNRQNTLYALVRGLNDYLEDRLAGVQHAHYLEVNDLRQYYGDATAYDGYVSHFTHGGVLSSRQGHLIHLGILERVQAALRVLRSTQPIKLIITDLDCTLWKGVLAEADEIIPLEVTEGWPLGYVEALLACKQRGILLAICSKNEASATRHNFKKVWGNRLQLDDFCSIQINWQPKSANIARILAETNILPEHTLFIDDNPQEISEVTRAYSQIRTLSGNPERWRHLLLYAPETQVLRVTEESAHRTELIQAKMARDQAAPVQDREAWLQDLGLTLRFDRIADARHSRYARALELLNKTNQFNTTGQRWSDAGIQAWLNSGGWLLAASVEDRFANHGLIALALLRDNEIVQVVLSCRVFGLGIETALLAEAIGHLQAAGHTDYVGHFTATGRNDACRDFWPAHGFTMDANACMWRGSLPPYCPEWIHMEGL